MTSFNWFLIGAFSMGLVVALISLLKGSAINTVIVATVLGVCGIIIAMSLEGEVKDETKS